MVINWEMMTVFTVFFVAVTALGFWAARWRAGDLRRLTEWGLAGRRFGSVITWFLMGGDMYTAYTFMAVPALVFAQGAQGFFAIPAFTLMYPIALIFMPRFWTLARHRGYVTTADFVQERFGSKTLALIIAVTGILATMPYIAIQIYGMQVVLAQMGFPVEYALIIAFVILSAYTYFSGLRGPAVIAIVKDISIWIIVLVAFFSIGSRLGGLDKIFAAVPIEKQTLAPQQLSAYATLVIGSAFPLFLYPHAITGILSTNSRKVVKRTAAFLLAYTFLQGMLGLLGFMAIAASIKASPIYQTNSILPALFDTLFHDQPWFTGFAFAAICIGALVPAGIMSIGAANLFTRNIYREYMRPQCSEREEANMAKTVSFVVKLGAMAFIFFFPTTFAINLQLFGNVWMLQTLPAVFIGLFTNWFHRLALIVGWAAGMIIGTWMMISSLPKSVFPFSIGGVAMPIYPAFAAVVVNLLLCGTLTLVFRAVGIREGQDVTLPSDYEAQPVAGIERTPRLSPERPSPMYTPSNTPLYTPPNTPQPAQMPLPLQGRSSPSWSSQRSQPQLMPLDGSQDSGQRRR